MLSAKSHDSPRRNPFFGALRMHLGPEMLGSAGRSGSPPTSTRPSSAIPMEDSREDGNQQRMSLDISSPHRRAIAPEPGPSSRSGSFDGITATRKSRHRKDVSMDYGDTSENPSYVPESRSNSLSQLMQMPRQALSGMFNRILYSQSGSEFHEKDVRYPTLPPLQRLEGSIPGAFPESPQKGPSTIELPQASAIGSERPTPKLPPIVLENRGRSSPFARTPHFPPLSSISPVNRVRVLPEDEGPRSPRPSLFEERAARASMLAGRLKVPQGYNIDDEAPTTGSNEQTPLARPRPMRSPAPRKEVIIEPAGSDTEMESDIPTRPVSPEAHYRHPFREPPYRFPAAQSPPPPVPFNRRGISNETLERFPVIVAHAPNHQTLWDRLSAGTLFTVARVANDLGITLDTLESEALEPLVGRNITMGRVEEILRLARGEDWVEVEIPDSHADKELRQVSDELDWEAEQIVGGTGEMLGWREERGTRYGGKVQFAGTLKVDENVGIRSKKANSKTGPLDLTNFGQITLEPPSIRGSSTFTRTFGSHHIFRIRVSKKIQSEFSVWSRSGDSRQSAAKIVTEWSERPIFILGRIYAPFREKDDVFFYFLEGPELVGEAFDNGRRGYGVPECTTVRQLIDWWVPLHHNGSQPFNKLATRLELGLSDTLPGMFIFPRDIEIADDLVNDRNVEFTDGAGLMTPSVAVSLLRKYGEGTSYQLHIAYQIRIHTAKGVLLVDPANLLEHSRYEKPHKLKLYRSMCKSRRGSPTIRSGPVNGFHILDAACCILCIVKPAPTSSAAGARLSSQFITILSDCGVPNDIFLKLQSKVLRQELATWTQMTTEEYYDHSTSQRAFRIDQTTRLRLARTIGKAKGLHLMTKKKELGGTAKGLGYGRTKKADRMDEIEEEDETESSSDDEPPAMMAVGRFESFASMGTMSGKVKRPTDPWATNEISGLPAMKSQQLQLAFLAGVDVARSNYFNKIWLEIAEAAMFSFVTKFHLPVERSASGFLQPDPTGILEEGEICFTVKEVMVDSETGLPTRTLEGPVLVGRHPALLPTDIRKVTARAVQYLQCHPGILFCSVKGDLPLASILAGGDYDGDEGTVIWERTIVEPFQNADLDLRLPPNGFDDRFETIGVKTSEVDEELRNLRGSELSKRLSKHLMGSVGEGNTFKIYNSFSNMATYRDGLRGYQTSSGEFVETESSRIMGHTFNYLMDSRKTGIRIKPAVLAKDKEEWSLYEEPYWLRRQKKLLSAANSKLNQKQLKPKNGETHILDRLVLDGEAELTIALRELEDALRPAKRGQGELYFDGNGTDGDLTYHWEAAQKWASGFPEREIELEWLKKGVLASQESFRELNVDSARKRTTNVQRRSQLREICQKFASLRVGQVDMMGTLSEETWRFVKASCAYVCDARFRGGEKNGFAWHVAFRDLCTIKARAIGEGHTFTIPFSVMERMDIHRHWG